MIRKTSNLTVSLPKCRNCGRHWRPSAGVLASAAFCKKCATERRLLAASKFGVSLLRPQDLSGLYVLPRRLRSR